MARKRTRDSKSVVAARKKARTALVSVAAMQAVKIAANKSGRIIAEEAAEKAVTKTFLALGLDIVTPAGVIEAQKDFAHGRKTRIAAESRNAKIVVALTGTLLSVFGAVITLAIQRIFFKG